MPYLSSDFQGGSWSQAIKALLGHWRGDKQYVHISCLLSLPAWVDEPHSSGVTFLFPRARNWGGLSEIQAWFLGCKGQCLVSTEWPPSNGRHGFTAGLPFQHLRWAVSQRMGPLPPKALPVRCSPMVSLRWRPDTHLERKFRKDYSGGISRFRSQLQCLNQRHSRSLSSPWGWTLSWSPLLCTPCLPFWLQTLLHLPLLQFPIISTLFSKALPIGSIVISSERPSLPGRSWDCTSWS